MRLNCRSFTVALDIDQHDDKQEQHHDAARVNNDLHASDKRRIEHQVETRHRQQRQNSASAECTALRRVITSTRRAQPIPTADKRRMESRPGSSDYHPTIAVTISTPSEIGSITFHPHAHQLVEAVSAAQVARYQINMYMKTAIFITKPVNVVQRIGGAASAT